MQGNCPCVCTTGVLLGGVVCQVFLAWMPSDVEVAKLDLAGDMKNLISIARVICNTNSCVTCCCSGLGLVECFKGQAEYFAFLMDVVLEQGTAGHPVLYPQFA